MSTPTVSPTAVGTPLSDREQVVGVFFGLWMIVGLFLDGWAHDNNKPESFFTPWHGILYSGFAGAGAGAAWIALRRHRPGRPLREALPEGHGLTLAALAVFATAAFGDLVWHETLGIEVGVEALLSPTHLLLLGSGIVALSAPLRAAWSTSPGAPDGLRQFLSPLLSLALLTALVGFFMLYLSPFVNDAPAQGFDRLASTPHEHPADDPAELRQLLGIASVLMTTVLLAVPTHLLLRRWAPPQGAFVVFYGVVVSLFVALNEFGHAAAIAAALAAGAAADQVARRWPPATGAVAVSALWLGYFATYQLTVGGVAWVAEIWTGTVVLSALLAAGIGVLAHAPDADATVAQPTGSSHRATGRASSEVEIEAKGTEAAGAGVGANGTARP